MATSEPLTGVTIRDLLDAGLHFGHQTKRWNPKMKRYIFGKRNGIHIMDLAKSHSLLNKALEYLYETTVNGGTVLFVGTKKQAQEVIKDAATAANQPYVTYRWLGGTLTNNVTIQRSVRRMEELEKLEKNGGLAAMHKKEASVVRRELEKLRRDLTGIASMKRLPSALFVIDISREAIAVKEANKLNIPVVAIVDTNCDPDPVDYLIPGNDDAIRAIKLIAGAVSDVVRKADAEYAKVAAENARKREESGKNAPADTRRPGRNDRQPADRQQSRKPRAKAVAREAAAPADAPAVTPETAAPEAAAGETATA